MRQQFFYLVWLYIEKGTNFETSQYYTDNDGITQFIVLYVVAQNPVQYQ